MTTQSPFTFPSNFMIRPIMVSAGCWIIAGNFHIHVRDRPSRFHRLMARVLLGWHWQDSRQTEDAK